MPSYYGNLVDDATKRRLNTEAVQSFDTGLKRLTANSRPVISNAYGVGSLPTPAGGGIPSGYMPQSFPQRTPQSNPLGFLNDAGQTGFPSRTPGAPARTPGASLPAPDFIPSYYGNLVDDATKRRLNTEAGQSFDTGLKRLTANALPVMSNAYGVGSLPAPAGGGIPSGYMPQSFPSRSPQSNPLSFLNDAGQSGPPSRTPGVPSRMPGASLPTPDFIAGNPGYATQTQSLSQGYNNALGNDVYAKGGTLTPGSAEYQAIRQTLGLPAEGNGPMYSRQYMAPGGTASGISSVAPGQGTVSVMGQGNGGTVEGNVAAINRQTAALQDLNQARLDDPNVGRFRFGTDGIRRGVDPLDVASGRTDSLGTLLPDVSRARTSQQLQLAEMAQRANALRLQDSSARSGQQLQANTARANTLADLFKQQQQFGLEQQRLGVDQQKINADTALRTNEQQQKWAQNTFENTFLKMPEADRKMAEADLTNHLMQLYDKGDQEGIKKLMPLASLILRYNPKPEDPLTAYLAQQQR